MSGTGFSVNERDDLEEDEAEGTGTIGITKGGIKIDFLGGGKSKEEDTLAVSESTLQTAFHLTGKESSQAETIKAAGKGGLAGVAGSKEGNEGKLFENRAPAHEDNRKLTGTGKYDLD